MDGGSRYLENAQGLMESHPDAILWLGKKYTISPIVIERAMHKMGRLGTEETT